MAPGIGGHETLGLYAEAIAKMNENAEIPALFRDIFKNAFLPYRDPETLKSFLKEIDGFTYEHSERLGDAFEYLLSVLGSQGDAGQFRTPRHIIDFMVEIVAPQKHEKVLDPACGTAGFLISAYKYILRTNQADRPGDQLTPDERKRLANNFKGYDICPDMVRLSLANMYLHGFTDPHIEEYDTLTSEDNWNELADVILANPPFMSPKGGIRPHKRFSIQAKRSEVLFVDYMAEDLTAAGRAAIIVPEGIIFQSQTAYRDLRRMLVENSLVAVVSLPAGCFNPYSGVKTSILFLDRCLARQADSIAFFKVENDGFGLGAQRRAMNKNDLPKVAQELRSYLANIIIPVVQRPHYQHGLVVRKSRIAAAGDYNLTGERLREHEPETTNYPLQLIASLVESVTPPAKIQKRAFGEFGQFPIIDQSDSYISGWTNDESAVVRPDKPLVIFGDHTCALKLLKTPFAQGAEGIKILKTHDELEPEFLYYILRSRPLLSSGYQRHYSKLKEMEIPLPPLEIQKEIVTEIEGYQKVIDGARTVLNNYRPHIPIHRDWPVSTFQNAPFQIIDGDRGVNYPGKEDFTAAGHCLFLNTKNVRSDGFRFDELEFISDKKDSALRKGKLARGDVVLTTRGTVGNVALYNAQVPFDHIRINSGMLIFRPDTCKLRSSYLFHFLQSANFKSQREAMVSGAAQPQLPIRTLNGAQIPVPPIATQESIVAEIEAEQALVAANRELIDRFEKKIQATLARVWGEADGA